MNFIIVRTKRNHYNKKKKRKQLSHKWLQTLKTKDNDKPNPTHHLPEINQAQRFLLYIQRNKRQAKEQKQETYWSDQDSKHDM